jgi:hypothetical protein
MQAPLFNTPVGVYEMGPLEVLDFGINWNQPAGGRSLGPWLQPGETITGTPTITQDGGDGQLTINPGDTETLVSSGMVTWWCSTPTIGQTYNVHATITTSLGRTSTRRIQIIGVDR